MLILFKLKVRIKKKIFGKEFKAVDSLSLEINEGKIYGFLGPNGAGKTTTIKMMTGILDITDGDILIDNKSIIKDPIEAKKRIGLVQDNPEIFLKLKGIEYLNFIADVYEISKEEIESKLSYPGTIKVTVIREMRAVDVAK